MKTTARTALLAFALLAVACTRPNRGSVFIEDVCAFPKDAKSCSFEAECTLVLMGYPWVYTQLLGAPNHLELPVQFNNQLPDNTDESMSHTNTNIAVVDTIELSYESADLGIAIPSISIPISTTIPTEGATVEMVYVLPEPIAQYLFDNWPATVPDPTYVTALVKLKGRYLSDSPFETGEFPITFQVVNGDFPGYACPVGTTLTAVCPHSGQSAATSCE